VARSSRDLGFGIRWTIARKLRERRKALGLGQADVVQRLKTGADVDVTIGGYSNWERNGVENIAILEALCYALECTPPYLMGWTDDPNGMRNDAGTVQDLVKGAAPRV
jgi:transcriptional regulator with XRE-family HTH domain